MKPFRTNLNSVIKKNLCNLHDSFPGVYYYSKTGAFIPVKSEQQFKIQSHFGIFVLEIGEGT